MGAMFTHSVIHSFTYPFIQRPFLKSLLNGVQSNPRKHWWPPQTAAALPFYCGSNALGCWVPHQSTPSSFHHPIFPMLQRELTTWSANGVTLPCFQNKQFDWISACKLRRLRWLPAFKEVIESLRGQDKWMSVFSTNEGAARKLSGNPWRALLHIHIYMLYIWTQACQRERSLCVVRIIHFSSVAQ